MGFFSFCVLKKSEYISDIIKWYNFFEFLNVVRKYVYIVGVLIDENDLWNIKCVSYRVN